eukprot:TRINITY_DN14695_c0_g1_i28.p1 TRINITY_DN14695_c0_g1~~TRINITY_DN14695_c0_g1_i28.p1  ORF type:complete len:203 (+),score=54.07 TRINITY_DN14695_c0_g1_i28:285-893(+)
MLRSLVGSEMCIRDRFSGAFVGEIQDASVRFSGVGVGDRMVEVSGQDVSAWPFEKIASMLRGFKNVPSSAVSRVPIVFQKVDGSTVKHVYEKEAILGSGLGISLTKRGQFAAAKRASYKERLTYYFEQCHPESVRKVDELLRAYRGREQALFQVLERKYGAAVPLSIPRLDPALAQDVIAIRDLKAMEAKMRHSEPRMARTV